MTTKMIQTGSPYMVHIRSKLLSIAGELISGELPVSSTKKIVLISDTNVTPLYADSVVLSLKKAGYQVLQYEFPAGEASKNWQLLGHLLQFLADHEITRSDALVALGGGVTGDLTGFAASVYLRGISFVQIPTTLLAAVDSSVGGKTAVNLPAGKNLAGTFWQPQLVICDTDTFSTLSPETFLDGIAESIKYGILRDASLFHDIAEGALHTNCETIVSRCIAMKGDIVSEDEFDQGTRELLNLGHTYGHAIETLSNYQTSHGQAVATGMDMAGKTAYHLGLCSQNCCQTITATLKNLGFALYCPYSKEELAAVMLRDKKRRGNTIDLILPYEIGDCRIYPVSIEQFAHF